MRKFVTVRKISDIQPIVGVDRIKVAIVDGWEVVVKADEFAVGDDCVFFEIDSFIPVEDDRFEFMHKSSLREYDGKKGVRVKTIKLRGQVSQGLALPLSAFPEILDAISDMTEEEKYDAAFDELLGVIKYDTFTARRGNGPKIIPAHAAGAFPWYIPKTDEERIENLWSKKDRLTDGDLAKEYYYTLKVDGSSTTVFLADEHLGYYDGIDIDEHGFQAVVCSRNLALKYNPEATFWEAVERSGAITAIKAIKKACGRTLAIQGETLAPCIQDGREKFEKPTFLAFCAYDIDEHKYVPYDEFIKIMDYWEIPRVPVLKTGSPFTEFETINDMKEFVDGIKEMFGDRVFADVPEGIVFHPVGTEGEQQRKSFKCISRKYLLKTGNDMCQKPETLDDHIEAMLDARYVVRTDVANLITKDVVDTVPLQVNDCIDSTDDLSERIVFAALIDGFFDVIISKRFVAWECVVHRQTIYFKFFSKENSWLCPDIIIPTYYQADSVPNAVYRGVVNL